MKVLLPPQKTFDSPITFEEYFYPDIPCGIPELSRIPEAFLKGPQMLNAVVQNRRLMAPLPEHPDQARGQC